MANLFPQFADPLHIGPQTLEINVLIHGPVIFQVYARRNCKFGTNTCEISLVLRLIKGHDTQIDADLD